MPSLPRRSRKSDVLPLPPKEGSHPRAMHAIQEDLRKKQGNVLKERRPTSQIFCVSRKVLSITDI